MADILTKAITKDGFFKISAVVSTESAEQARRFHNTSPVATAALGRLLSAGLLMGGELKEENSKLTLQMKGNGPLRTVLVAANSKGEVKGYVENPLVDIPLKPNGKLDVGGAIGSGSLSVIKDLCLKEPYIGQVALQTGEVGDDLAYYFMQSEQVPSVVALGVLVDRDYSVKCSGGFIVQVMPECDDKSITKLENSIGGIMSVTEMLSSGMNGEDIIKYVMLGFDVDILESHEVGYVCDCSRERMERAIISLGKKEIDDIIKEQGEAEIVCSFCNTAYKFDAEQLEEMKNSAKDTNLKK
ncbi:MAG: Hsp33 family molecular chaperone HslO [Clostridia bacterium]|nr:Hsp33 family molecular chaperone HslO [Clostridia bacterium]